MKDLTWNFEKIKNAVDAASFAQDAGYDEACTAILKKLALELPRDEEKNND